MRNNIVKKCVYCLSEINTKNPVVKYCSERCRSYYKRTNKVSMNFSIYPTEERIKEKIKTTKDLTILSNYFGMKESNLKFFILEKYKLLSVEELETHKKLNQDKRIIEKISRQDKFRNCLKCKKTFEIINQSTALYCSATCRTLNQGVSLNYTEKPTKELLEKLYLDEGYSTTQIAEYLNCTQPNAYYLLKKFKIPLRNKNGKNRNDKIL